MVCHVVEDDAVVVDDVFVERTPYATKGGAVAR